MRDFLAKIREQIKRGNTTQSIDLLIDLCSTLSKEDDTWNDLYNELTLTYNRFKRLSNDFTNGIITTEHKTLEENKISKQLITILNQLEKDRDLINGKINNKSNQAKNYFEFNIQNIQENKHPRIQDIGFAFLNYTLKDVRFDSNILVKTVENVLLIKNIFWDRLAMIQSNRFLNGKEPIRLKIACHFREQLKIDTNQELQTRIVKNKTRFKEYGGIISYVFKINSTKEVKSVPSELQDLADLDRVEVKVIQIHNDVFRERDYILLEEENLILEWIVGYLNKPINNLTLRGIRQKDEIIDDWKILYRSSGIIKKKNKPQQ